MPAFLLILPFLLLASSQTGGSATVQIEFRGLGLQPSDDLGVKVKPHTLLLGCNFPNIGLRGGVLSQGRIHFGAADDPGSPRWEKPLLSSTLIPGA